MPSKLTPAALLYRSRRAAGLCTQSGCEKKTHGKSSLCRKHKKDHIARSVRWQEKKKEEGKCRICGRLSSDCVVCEKCSTVRRKRTGHSKWKPGGLGRPPLWYLTQQPKYPSLTK